MQSQVVRAIAETADQQALVKDAVIEEGGAQDMNHVAFHLQPIAMLNFRIGEVGGEQSDRRLHIRAEQQRPPAFALQLEPGEMARVAVVETENAARAGHDIAMPVEQGEPVAVLQGAKPAVMEIARGRNVELRGILGPACCNRIVRHCLLHPACGSSPREREEGLGTEGAVSTSRRPSLSSSSPR